MKPMKFFNLNFSGIFFEKLVLLRVFHELHELYERQKTSQKTASIQKTKSNLYFRVGGFFPQKSDIFTRY